MARLREGALLPSGLRTREAIGQGHKVALTDLPAGAQVVRYGIVIGRASVDVPAGGWVHEQRLHIPESPALSGLPAATRTAVLPPLTGHTFQGYRNRDGSIGTRNVLAVTTIVHCVAATSSMRYGVSGRSYPRVDDVVGLEHSYGCGVAIDAPGAEIPVRTRRNISLNPNLGGEIRFSAHRR